jgi:RNA polymerase sigma factor (sigma-70 family)
MARALEDDHIWLEGFRRGERSALERVYRHYVDGVTLTLRRGVLVAVDGATVRLGTQLPEHEIEQLIQDTFVRAFSPSARAAYDGIRPFGAYLATIARNLLVDRGRRLGRDRRLVPLEETAEPAADDVQGDIVLTGELAHVVARFVTGLPPLEQQFFKARYAEEQGLREAAAIIGVAYITARRLDARLRAGVLEALRAAGHLRDRQVGIPQTVRDRSKG